MKCWQWKLGATGSTRETTVVKSPPHPPCFQSHDLSPSHSSSILLYWRVGAQCCCFPLRLLEFRTSACLVSSISTSLSLSPSPRHTHTHLEDLCSPEFHLKHHVKENKRPCGRTIGHVCTSWRPKVRQTSLSVQLAGRKHMHTAGRTSLMHTRQHAFVPQTCCTQSMLSFLMLLQFCGGRGGLVVLLLLLLLLRILIQ